MPRTYTLAVDGLGTIHITTPDRNQVVRLAKELRAQRVGYSLINQDDADLVGYFADDEIAEDGASHGQVYQ